MIIGTATLAIFVFLTLSPINLRLTLLYNVELEDDFDFALLPALTRLHSWPALQVPPQLHDAMVGLAVNLVPNPSTLSPILSSTLSPILSSTLSPTLQHPPTHRRLPDCLTRASAL